MAETFLIKVSGARYPDGIAQPKLASDWNHKVLTVPWWSSGRAFQTDKIAPGDALWIWVNETQGGRGFTAEATAASLADEIDEPRESQVLLSDITLHPRGIDNAALDEYLQAGQALDPDVRSRATQNNYQLTEQQAITWRRLIFDTSDPDNLVKLVADLENDPDAHEHDIRKRAKQEVRLGQRRFRQALVDRYGARCAITGPAPKEALEAAHVVPFSKNRALSENRGNGLLLRADLHRLFDRLLFSIEGNRVRLANSIRGGCYKQLHNSPVSTDAEPDLLAWHYRIFQEEEAIRNSEAQ